MRYVIPVQPGFSDREAVIVLDKLSQENIVANYVMGGVAVYPKNDTEFKFMQQMCADMKIFFDDGNTMKEEDVLNLEIKI